MVVAFATTVLVTTLSWLSPQKYSATLVGLAFLGVTWWMVLRHDEETIRRHGLALGGLLEPLRIEPRRLLRDLGRALGVAVAFCVVVFPAYAVGFWAWWSPRRAFHLRLPPSIFDELTGQVLVIALPEEAFFRGYLQTAFDDVWPPRWKIFGAMLGPGWLLTALIFAVGHVLTNPNPGRMAVFFPALIFGWMRARTGGIGTGVAFHAACNLFSATLIRGYGMTVP
jgi:membrane protease YdiL (CAAX protease family)